MVLTGGTLQPISELRDRLFPQLPHEKVSTFTGSPILLKRLETYPLHLLLHRENNRGELLFSKTSQCIHRFLHHACASDAGPRLLMWPYRTTRKYTPTCYCTRTRGPYVRFYVPVPQFSDYGKTLISWCTYPFCIVLNFTCLGLWF